MPPNRITRPGESSRSTSHPSEEEESSQYESYTNYTATDEELEDEGDYEHEAVYPCDSASAINELPPSRPRSGRSASRHHRTSRQEAQYPPAQSHALNSPSVDTPDDFAGYYSQAQPFQPLPAQRGGAGYYGGRGHSHPFAHNHANHYMGGYPNGGQMVPYSYGPGQHPFGPMSNNSSGASYFGGEPRPMYDVMPYQPGFYGPQYGLAAQLHQLHLTPPAPPATEAPPQPTSPPPPKEPPVDIEKIRRDAEEAAKKDQEDKQRAIDEAQKREALIRKEAEESFQRRLEEAKKQQEEAQKAIAQAKAEADEAAVKRMEAQKKADEDRSRLQAEEMRRAEENAIRQYEAKAKAEEERKKRELEDRIRIEEATKAQVHAMLKAEADAKAAAEKKAAEEAERLKLLQEEAKRKAELDALAKIEADKEAAKKAAEAEAAAKKEHEALKKRIMDETKAKLEEAAAKKSDKGSINFKDAVGRKFNFPFSLVCSWQGMEELIKQAFLHVDIIGPHVQEGHYDLTGPNGEIILPSIWEKVIQPDWSINMTMWPVEKRPQLAVPSRPTMRDRGGVPIPPPPPMGMGMGPPPDWAADRRRHPHIPNIDIIDVGPPPKSKKSAAKRNSAMLGFFAGTGKPVKKKSSKK